MAWTAGVGGGNTSAPLHSIASSSINVADETPPSTANRPPNPQRLGIRQVHACAAAAISWRGCSRRPRPRRPARLLAIAPAVTRQIDAEDVEETA
jgi:hypothetical protein